MGFRILQVITDQDRRGAQVFAEDLQQALDRRGHEVRTVALAPGQHTNPLPVPTLGATRLSPATLVSLRRSLGHAEIVIAHGSSTLPACGIAGLGTNVPFLYRQISDSLFWAPTRMRQLRVRLALRRARGVVALWEGSAETLHQHFGVPRDQMRVIPNGVPSARFRPPSKEEKRAARKKLLLPNGSPVVLYVGALAPEKGVDLAISAIGLLPSASLLVAGAGPTEKLLRHQAETLAPGRVSFLGSLADTRDAYAAADVLVMPSRGGDSMPAVLIEAGLCGLAAVSTPVGAIPQIVLDGTTGFLVPVGDVNALSSALERALADGRRLGTAARDHCLANFDIDVVAVQWERAIHSFLR